MFSVSSDRHRSDAQLPTWLGGLVDSLGREFDDVAEEVVEAQVWRAVDAVEFFGDDPSAHLDVVARMAANELTILTGRDSDRARA